MGENTAVIFTILKSPNKSEHLIENNRLDQLSYQLNVAYNKTFENNYFVEEKMLEQIYVCAFICLIVIGICVNLIVIITYKFGDRGKMLNAQTSTNAAQFANKIIGQFGQNKKDSNTFTNEQQDLPRLGSKRTHRNSESAYTRFMDQRSILIYHQNRPSRHSVDCIDIANMRRSPPNLKKISITKPLNERKCSSIDAFGLGNNNNTYLTLPLGVGHASSIRRTLCSYFILSLGICDLFICAVNMPLSLVVQHGNKWSDQIIDDLFASFKTARGRDVMCKAAYFFLQLPITLEIEILLMIAIDRYSSVFRSIESYFFDKKKFKFILIGQILISSVLSLPNFLFYKFNTDNYFKSRTSHHTNQTSSSVGNLCVVDNRISRLYALYQLILFCLFVTILLIIMICYMKVYKHVYKASRNQRRESTISHFQNNHNNMNGTPLSHHQDQSNPSCGHDESLSSFGSKFNPFKCLTCCFRSKTSEKKVKTSLENDGFRLKRESIVSCMQFKHPGDTIDGFLPIESSNKNFNFYKEEFALNEEEEKSEIVEKKIERNEQPETAEVKLASLSSQLDAMPLDVPHSLIGPIEEEYNTDVYNKFQEETTNVNVNIDNNPNKKQPLKKSHSVECTETLKAVAETDSSIAKHMSIPVLEMTSKKTPIGIIRKDGFVGNFERNKTKIEHLESQKNPKMSQTPTIISKLRRFSENHVFHSNLMEFPNPSAVAIRRHTSRRFKHGRTARVLGLTTLAFAITWVPFWIYLYKTIETTSNTKKLSDLTFIEYLLLNYAKNTFYFNYILNPIFYSFVNQRFRRIFFTLSKKVFKFCLRCVCFLFCCCLCCFSKKNVTTGGSCARLAKQNSNFYYCSSQSFSSNLYPTTNNTTHNNNAHNTHNSSFRINQTQNRRSRMNSFRSDTANSASFNYSTSFKANLYNFMSKKMSLCCSMFKSGSQFGLGSKD